MWTRPPTRVAVALGVGLALTAIALVVVLSGSPIAVAHSNGVVPNEALAETPSAAEVCQDGETLPAGTTAIRITISSLAGPRVHVSARSAGRLLTSGDVASGWVAGAVTVPVHPPRATSSPVRLCFGWGQTVERVGLYGSPTSAAAAARTTDGSVLPGRVTIQYLRPASATWWSRALTVARRMGLGRSPSGTWIALLVAAMMALAVATAYRTAAGTLR